MPDRQKALARLAAVQKQMVRLSEWRLAQAEQRVREITESQTRLQTYVVEAGAIGAPLARAALRSLHKLDAGLVDAERSRAATQAGLQTTKQREKAVAERLIRVERVARREADDRALADVVETWLAAKDAKGTSLP